MSDQPSLTSLSLVATALFLLAGACSSAEPDDAPSDGVTLRLVAPDGNIREPGVACSGAGAYRYAHPEAPFEIADASGDTVATGTLPSGTAEKGFNVDLGDVRQPTVCVMMVDVPGLDSLEDHSFVIDGRRPLPIAANANLDDIPEVVLS